MRKIIVAAPLFCLIITPCHALTFFKADYDADSYTTENLDYGEWLPLRELSSILPYEVEWKDRTIYVYADKTWEIKPDRWIPPGVKIVDGVTYVTERYMRRFVPDSSFLYQNELYVFDGETERSELVRGNETFRENVLSTMYRLKIALPKDYKLIRKHLRGGIEESETEPGMPLQASAYIFPTASRPTAYIVASAMTGANLAELIAHEAYHVYLERWNKQSEDKAIEYGQQIKAELIETM